MENQILQPIWITATRMFVASNLSRLCATALLVFSSLIFSTTTAIAVPDTDATALQNAAYAAQGQKQVLEGELEVIYEDYEDHSKSRLRHVLKTKNGRVELHLPEHSKGQALQSGTKVRVRGWLFKDGEETLDSLALDSEQDSLEVLALDNSTTTTSTASTTSATLPNTLGEQRTLVLLLNFQDNANEQPWTVEETREMVFGTVNDFYKENSNGRTWLSGDVQGYLTLPINATCDFGTMDDYAQQAARDSGIDVGSYKRLVYLFPQNSACGWRGQGTVGGTPSRSWINGELNLLTIGHEMGHNLGLHHAKYIGCNDGNIDDSCVSLEYGDNLDIMGKSTGHFNAFNKERLGWLSSSSGEIITAETDGSYLLEPYESASTGVAKGLKVIRGIDAASGDKLWYYLEYRQALGFDSFLSGKSGITDGVLVHLNIESDIESSQLLDMTPNSNIHDLDDAALIAGSSYNDPDAGVTITTEWADASGVSVHVSFSEQVCSQNSPGITLTANENGGVAAGSTVNYSATVTNQNSSGCASSDFNVSASVPAGWAATSSTLNLAPGASGTVTINVTSTDTAADGAYEITINAENSRDSSYNSSAVASYLLETPAVACVSANPALLLLVNDSGELAAGTMATYHGTLTNQDSSSCANADFDISANLPDGWSSENVSVNLAPGETTNISLNVTSNANAGDGVYDFNISAQNRMESAYSSNAAASYTVAAAMPVCVAAMPSIVVSNPQAAEVAAGTQANYSATITNNNSEGCSEASFAVSADVPAGWSAGSSELNLAAGESATVNISVTSATTASEGSYNIAISAQNSTDSSDSSSAMVSYLVATPQAPFNSVPVALDDNVELTAKEAVLIDVLANDYDPDGDSLSVTAVSQGAKGSVQITGDGQLLYTPSKSFKGDSFSYTISDGDKTAAATVTLSLIRLKK